MGGETIEKQIQSNDIQFNFDTEYPYAPSWLQSEMLMMLSLKAPKLEEQEKRPPLDLVCVVDKSGSMSGSKIEIVKKTVNFIISQLEKTDRLALITYSDVANVEFNLTQMDEENKKASMERVNSIRPYGSTNLSGGLQEGVKVLKERLTNNDVSSILLFTDGFANLGLTRANDIVKWMRTGQLTHHNFVQEYINPPFIPRTKKVHFEEPKYKSSESHESVSSICTVNTFGFGFDHDPEFLKKISDEGNGIYFYIKDEESIPEAFLNCLGGLISTVAKDVRIKVQPVNGITVKKVHTNFKTTSYPDGTFAIYLKDIQSEEEKNILFDISLPKCDKALNVPILNFQIDYYNIILNEKTEYKLVGNISRPSQVLHQPSVNRKVDVQKNRILALEVMEKVDDMANAGQFEQAKKIIDEAIASIKNSVTHNDQFCINLIQDLEKTKAGLKDKNSWSSGGRQLLMNNFVGQQQQRQSNFNSPSQAIYMNSSRVRLRKKMYENKAYWGFK